LQVRVLPGELGIHLDSVGDNIVQARVWKKPDNYIGNWSQKGGEKMSANETFEQLKNLVVELLEVDEEAVVPEASFADDFDADSLDIIELISAVEDTFKIEIPDEDVEKLQTVQDALDYIEAKI
jgi:acyl carrier protein